MAQRFSAETRRLLALYSGDRALTDIIRTLDRVATAQDKRLDTFKDAAQEANADLKQKLRALEDRVEALEGAP